MKQTLNISFFLGDLDSGGIFVLAPCGNIVREIRVHTVRDIQVCCYS